ncbi:recombinase family protein [Faecalispora anaeroviscerum]|uniref:recombinase family protein n=1 Tax=Faecalispora anaeroviscerum TaxID=2991836 RepID=UPI0024B8FBC3|nr:recombinase family protein [Faecalispora anaeroviscerum]
MNAVIYARYSSDNQREESIEGQLRECKAYAEKNGITVLSTYIDRALSAKTDHRPEFQHMVKDSAKGLFDIVLVWKLDRFSRNRYDSAHYKTVLRKNGAKVVSATESISEDSTGILLESLLEGYAEFYSAELSEKVIRGLTENALKCKYNGGGLPIGYTIDNEQNFQIDPLTAPIVLEAFQRYAKGATVKQLVDFLNSKGIQTYRNKPLRIDCVKRLLKNRRYIGEYKYRNTVTPNGVPAIIPQDLFDRVGERLEKNKKAPARAKAKEEMYLLTTKLFCGCCGAYMCGESGTSRNSTIHQYYKCVTAKYKKACHKKTVKKDWIENLVIEHIVKLLFDDALMNDLTDTLVAFQKRENTTLPMLKQRLIETEKGIENILNAIQQGILTQSTKQRLDELEETRSSLEVSIIQEEMQKPLLTKEQLLFWLHRFRALDVTNPAHRQRLVDSFVNAIYLYDDKIVLMFNYKEGSKTINFSDIECSSLSAGAAPKGPRSLIVSWAFFLLQLCFRRIRACKLA